MSRTIDLNSDTGESFGAYRIGNDQEVFDVVSSANIACGFHAGDPAQMNKSVALALEKDVKIGAHPGYQDLAGFGRRNMALSPEEIYQIVTYQIGALQAFCHAHNTEVYHVKPHGALYNFAARDSEAALAIAEAVKACDENLILYGLSGSCLIEAGKETGIKTASEVFADRHYRSDGSLVPRSDNHAVIKNWEEACDQVIRMIKSGTVLADDGSEVKVEADTVCLHGDHADAVQFARHLRTRLTEEGVTIAPVPR